MLSIDTRHTVSGHSYAASDRGLIPGPQMEMDHWSLAILVTVFLKVSLLSICEV